MLCADLELFMKLIKNVYVVKDRRGTGTTTEYQTNPEATWVHAARMAVMYVRIFKDFVLNVFVRTQEQKNLISVLLELTQRRHVFLKT